MQHYKPSTEELTSGEYERCKCPFLNSLANHGIISRKGKDIPMVDVIGILRNTLSYYHYFVFSCVAFYYNCKRFSLNDFEDKQLLQFHKDNNLFWCNGNYDKLHSFLLTIDREYLIKEDFNVLLCSDSIKKEFKFQQVELRLLFRVLGNNGRINKRELTDFILNGNLSKTQYFDKFKY